MILGDATGVIHLSHHQTLLMAHSMKLVKSKLKITNSKTYLPCQRWIVLTQMTVPKNMKLKVCLDVFVLVFLQFTIYPSYRN